MCAISIFSYFPSLFVAFSKTCHFSECSSKRRHADLLLHLISPTPRTQRDYFGSDTGNFPAASSTQPLFLGRVCKFITQISKSSRLSTGPPT